MALFKLVFGAYMLVSVVVLINLLIAMMSDTYQRIQAQSDIEWKFGLSKLIRSMHRTTTAPAPINLITTWLFYLIDLCKEAKAKKIQRPDVLRVISHMQAKSMSPRSKAGAKWLSLIKKEPIGLSTPLIHHQGSFQSEMEINLGATRIEHVTDWEVVAKKYRDLMGYEDDSKESDNMDVI